VKGRIPPWKTEQRQREVAFFTYERGKAALEINTRILNAASIVITVSVTKWKNRLNAEIAFRISVKIRLTQKPNTAVSLRIVQILNP